LTHTVYCILAKTDPPYKIISMEKDQLENKVEREKTLFATNMYRNTVHTIEDTQIKWQVARTGISPTSQRRLTEDITE